MSINKNSVQDIENLNEIIIEESLETNVTNNDDVNEILEAGDEGKAESIKDVIVECTKTENILTKEANDKVEKEGYSKYVVLAVIFAYLLGDVSKNVLDRKAVHGTGINSNVLPIIYAFLNIILAFGATMFFEGKNGVKSLFKWETLKLFAIPAFFFASSQGVGLLVSQNLDAGCKKVLSQIRIPMTAVIGRFIMGSSYTTLQWLGMVCVLSACACFHFLTQDPSSEIDTSKQDSLIKGIVFLIVQNILAVLGSLFAEKFLKSQKKVAFYKQKFQIEVWGFLSGLLLWVAVFPYIFGYILYGFSGKYTDVSDKFVTSKRAEFNVVKIGKVDETKPEFPKLRLVNYETELNNLFPITKKENLSEDEKKINEENKMASKYFNTINKKVATKDINGRTISLENDLNNELYLLKTECEKEDKSTIEPLCQLKYDYVNTAIKFEKYMKLVNKIKNSNFIKTKYEKDHTTVSASDLESKIYLYINGKVLKRATYTEKDLEKLENECKLKDTFNDTDDKDENCDKIEEIKMNITKTSKPSVFEKDSTSSTDDKKVYVQKNSKTNEIEYTLTVEGKKTTNSDGTESITYKTEITYGTEEDKKEYFNCDADILYDLETSGEQYEKYDYTCTNTLENENDVTINVFPGVVGYGSKLKKGSICTPKTCTTDEYSFQNVAYTSSPFYGFSLWIAAAIVANLLQSWMSGLISKVLSSLMKNVFGAVATALIVLVEMFGDRSSEARVFCAIFIVILSALVFGQIPKAPKKN